MFAIPPRRGRAVVRAARGGRMWSRNLSSGGMVSAEECGAGTSVPAGCVWRGAGPVGSVAVARTSRLRRPWTGSPGCSVRAKTRSAAAAAATARLAAAPLPSGSARRRSRRASGAAALRTGPSGRLPRASTGCGRLARAFSCARLCTPCPPATRGRRRPGRTRGSARGALRPSRPAPFAPDFDPARFAASVRVERPARGPSPALAPRAPPRVPPAFFRRWRRLPLREPATLAAAAGPASAPARRRRNHGSPA